MALQSRWLWPVGWVWRWVLVLVFGAAGAVAMGGARPVWAGPSERLVGLSGRAPRLIMDPGGERAYLFVSTPGVVVRTFDLVHRLWLPGELRAPGTDGVYVGPNGSGGPAYAVDSSGGIHVLWSEAGPCECPQAEDGRAGVRLMHVAYEDGVWSEPEVIVSRQAGDATCFFHDVSLAADGKGRLLAVYSVGSSDPAQERVACRVFDEGWQAEQVLTWNLSETAASGFWDTLLVAYERPRGDRAWAQDFAAVWPWDDKVGVPMEFFKGALSFAHRPKAPAMAFGGDYDVYLAWAEQCEPYDWRLCRLFFNHCDDRGQWVYGPESLELFGPNFVPEGLGELALPDWEAHVAVAASPAGGPNAVILVAFTFQNRLYFVSYDGATWAGPEAQRNLPTGANAVAALGVGPDRFLVVWNEPGLTYSPIWYEVATICPVGARNCSGHCADLSSDPMDCGECGRRCAADEVCDQGRCRFVPLPDASVADVGQSDSAASRDGALVEAGDGGDATVPGTARFGCACGLSDRVRGFGDAGWFLGVFGLLVVVRFRRRGRARRR